MGYSTVMTIAPMLTVIGALCIMEHFLGFDSVGYATRELFSCTVLYIFIFSLLTASPFNSVLSKYMSDIIYEETFEDILPCYYVGMILNITFSALFGISFCIHEYLVGNVDIIYVFTGYCGFVALVLVFYSMLYLSICKDYKKISFFFMIGMTVTVLLSFLFVKVIHMSITYGMLLALAIGFWLIACLEFALIRSYFRENSGRYRRVFHYFREYWPLVLTNLLYTLGLYIHNFVFWTTDLHMVIVRSFVCVTTYDMATCLAMFTNISASVIFISRVEILEGKLTDKGKCLCGSYRGYEIMVNQMNGFYQICINAHSDDDVNNQKLAAFLAEHKTKVKGVLDAKISPTALLMNVKMPAFGSKCPAAINEAVMPVIQYLTMGRYSSGCEYCKSENVPVSDYEINGMHHLVCENCAGQIGQNLQQNQQEVQAKKSRVAEGIVGAVLGSLIGCILWILIYKLGYIAGIAGAAIGICAMKGYEMLGGHLDKKGVVISSVIMVVMIYFGNRIAWSWDAYDALKDQGFTFFDSYQYLGEILDQTGLAGDYYTDLAIGYVLSFVCGARYIIHAFRASNGSYTMKKH